MNQEKCTARCTHGAWHGDLCELPKGHDGQHLATCWCGPRIGEQFWWGKDTKRRTLSGRQRL